MTFWDSWRPMDAITTQTLSNLCNGCESWKLDRESAQETECNMFSDAIEITRRKVVDGAGTPAVDVLLRQGPTMELAREHSKNGRATVGPPNVAQLRQTNARIGF